MTRAIAKPRRAGHRHRNWRRSPWTAVVVAGLAAAVLVPQFVDVSGSSDAAPDPTADAVDSLAWVADVEVEAGSGFEPVRPDEDVPDPFRHDGPAFGDVPPAAPGGAGVAPRHTEPQVSLVLRLGGSRVAVVDGQLVRPGDRLGGGVVADVLVDGVQLRGAGGATQMLRLRAVAPRSMSAADGASDPPRQEPQPAAEPAGLPPTRRQTRRSLQDLDAMLGEIGAGSNAAPPGGER